MQNNDEGGLILEQFLPYRLSVLSNIISGSIADFYADTFDLSIPEWRVMAVLARNPGMSAAEVAEKTEMDKVAVSRAVARLLKSKRIKRKFATDDKRRSILELSAQGRKIYAKVIPSAKAYEKKLIEALSKEDLETLSDILVRLKNRADDLRYTK